jgi:hypothetical protein
MNQGLLVIIALFLIYLAISGKYNCVTSAGRCIFFGEKMCACGPQGATQGTAQAGQLPDLIKGPIQTGADILKKAREAIDIIKGRK